MHTRLISLDFGSNIRFTRYKLPAELAEVWNAEEENHRAIANPLQLHDADYRQWLAASNPGKVQ